MKSRIGVFVCHCGHNIASSVDVLGLADALRRHPDVAFAADYKYMCSDPGQQLIRQAIADHRLDGVVVAACSPAMHETTFRRTADGAGVNPYRCECANIREQVSWVHQHDQTAATAKAGDIVRSIVERVRQDECLEPLRLALTRRCVVIGAGIAGMQAALDVAGAGYPVVLIERQSALGGRMAQLSGTYLNLEDGSDRLTRMIAAVERHANIQVLTEAEVTVCSGYVGNFQVEVRAGRPGGDEATPYTLDAGAIVVATGWDPYELSRLPEYGGGLLPDVVSTLEFERMLAPGGRLARPSDGVVPRQVVFIHCAGSRDPEHGVPYCSKTCCMVVAKQAMMFCQRVPEGQAYAFYIDLRTAGKGYEEYVRRSAEEHGVLYLRGKVSAVAAENGRLRVSGADTLSDLAVDIVADLVVLATPMVPADGAVPLGQTLHISTDADGFFNEAHPKLRPVETLTAGVYLAGTCQGPRDIPETLAQASGAAAKVLQLFSHEEMTQSPTVAAVVEDLCAACATCVGTCPYGARTLHPVRAVAVVNPALCQGCGACVVACPNKACFVRNWRPTQVLAMLDQVGWSGDRRTG
ncbi:MAG: CoB--CoM heterodisulfide reductase iron-sulfur subunit A family protein [Chloroflexi bacterium]|nr:CoB--CoM heterodisulfide reductase iron-sulfur subunit A family protein [Chloroflexota bacterium]